MNVEIGAEAVLFPKKEYINGIFVTVKNEKRLPVLREEQPESPPDCCL
jgi:hypothetical protein